MDNDEEVKWRMDSRAQQPIRFLALGDSYTIGEAVRPEESWPYQFVGMAGARGVPIDTPVVIARTGWTTDELLEGIRVESPAGTFELVSLLIGVNNLYRGWPPENFRTEFRVLLECALRYAQGKSEGVVVLSIPDWGATSFAEGRDRKSISIITDTFNEICRNEAKTRNVHYIDVTGVSRKGLTDEGLLATDGLHPSGVMYGLWARMVCDALFRSKGQ